MMFAKTPTTRGQEKNGGGFREETRVERSRRRGERDAGKPEEAKATAPAEFAEET